MFELYSYNNKIKKDKYEIIYEFTLDNYREINKDMEDSKVAHDVWVNTITNTKDYYILVYYINSYMYIDKGLCLSEVQIRKQYQNKGILKVLLKELINRCDKNRSNNICGTISFYNKKSIDIFTHIGMINTNNRWYEISCDNLLKWLNK